MNRNSRCFIQSASAVMGLGIALVLAAPGNASTKTVVAAQTQSTSTPRIAGQWQLNKDQSDDPRQKMQQAMGNNGQGGGEGGGGRRGGGMRGGGQGGGMMQDLSQLSIDQTDTSVKVSGESGRVLAIYPAPAQTAKPASNGDNGQGEAHEFAPPVAKWQGSQLVTTMEGRRGGSTTRTFELSPDGKQLVVTTKIQRPQMSQPVTIRFVYDPAKANSGSNQ